MRATLIFESPIRFKGFQVSELSSPLLYSCGALTAPGLWDLGFNLFGFRFMQFLAVLSNFESGSAFCLRSLIHPKP